MAKHEMSTHKQATIQTVRYIIYYYTVNDLIRYRLIDELFFCHGWKLVEQTGSQKQRMWIQLFSILSQ